MKQHALLKIASVLSIFLMTLHFAADTARARIGAPEAGGLTVIAAPILAIWLYGTLVLDEKRSGHVIMLIGSLLAIMMPAMHVIGPAGPFTRNNHQIRRSVPVRVDSSRDWRDGDLLFDTRGAGAVESAAASAPVVVPKVRRKAGGGA